VDHFPAGKQLSYLRSVNGQKEWVWLVLTVPQ
jgi:hypothetical protein